MYFSIKPIDTLFFRNSRPFTMGSETFGDCIFPPYPSTFYGALRSYLLLKNYTINDFLNGKFKDNDEIIKIIGTKNQKGKLKIKGPFIKKQDQIYFPKPLDLLGVENDYSASYLSLLDKPQILISDYPLEKILINNQIEGKIKDDEYFLDIENLKKYLTKQKEIKISKFNIYKKELKTGIKRNPNTKNTEEGHLYRIPLIRLSKEIEIIFKVDNNIESPIPLDNDVIKFGGENKVSIIYPLTDDLLKELEDIDFSINENKIFKIYFATPSIFKKGYLPEWIDENTLEGEYKHIKLKLVACSTGKFIRIGGWDIANNKPKPLYKAIPSGSIYYFKILDNSDFNKIKQVFHLKNISDINSEEGFGLTLMGTN
ncbi:MAG: hypothetical protein KatS3mg129_2527 [Leptospiraceae bacterium]|nr:MAG: hypothetical protein KatS3mg129_2527 [Leptospiraceae bacterium]